MAPFLPLHVLPPAPALTLASPSPHPRAACRHPAPLAASSKPTPRRPYRCCSAPVPAPPPPQRPQNAAPGDSFPARSEEELEAAIYDFMCMSAKPGAFPTRSELLAAGRADLAATVESSGGWLSLGWSSGPDSGPVSTGGGLHPDYPPKLASSVGGVHPDYPPEAGASDLASAEGTSGCSLMLFVCCAVIDCREAGFGTGLEGMLTRLQREREQARPSPRSSNQAGGQGDNGVHLLEFWKLKDMFCYSV